MEIAKVDLVGVGLNATDTLIPLAEYPARGSKLEYATAMVMPGGQTASTVVACQTWGLKTRYVGKLGSDAAAELHRNAFAKAGVDAELVIREGGVSPQSIILVDSGGERTVLCQRQPGMALKPEELKREWIVNARALHVDGFDTEAATQAALWAHEAGIPIIADLDEIYPGVDDLIRLIDYLIVSRDFPCKLMKEKNLEKALKGMQSRYSCKLTAATLGPDGVLAWNGRDLLLRPAFKVPVVDTTGAGDIFHAGFIFGLLQGWPTERTLDFSCAAAAMNCTAKGARGGIRPLETVEEMLSTVERYEQTEEFAHLL